MFAICVLESLVKHFSYFPSFFCCIENEKKIKFGEDSDFLASGLMTRWKGCAVGVYCKLSDVFEVIGFKRFYI